MLKVFLVEDECVVREGLRDCIDWERYGFEFCGDAPDGELALPQIRKLHPDILITDIKMPFMDGLALSKLVCAELPETRIILISGHNDFEFAQEAIEIGVEQYLLKPVTKTSLLKTLEDVSRKIDEEREQKAYLRQFQQEGQEYEQYARRKFFEQITSGTLTVNGTDVSTLSGKSLRRFRRGIGMVFQSFNLVTRTTVIKNVLSACVPDMPFWRVLLGAFRKADKIKALESLDKVGILDKAYIRADQLSGGQQQRVAIARALVNRPKVLLLDEPLGALDLRLRKDMQNELKRIQQEVGITFIFVTHDQEEALTMSDKIVVMQKGEILQIGTPQEIYNEPTNRFVANFIGESNIISGRMIEDYKVRFDDITFDCVDHGFKENEPVDVVIRPEDIDIVDVKDGKMTGEVLSVLFKGVHYEMHVECEGREWLIHSTRACTPGETIGMRIGPNEIHIMARSEG